MLELRLPDRLRLISLEDNDIVASADIAEELGGSLEFLPPDDEGHAEYRVEMPGCRPDDAREALPSSR